MVVDCVTWPSPSISDMHVYMVSFALAYLSVSCVPLEALEEVVMESKYRLMQ